MRTGYHRPDADQRPGGPRTAASSPGTNSPARNRPIAVALIDLAETEWADLYDLPGNEVPAEELAMEILSEQADEFTCSSCFLVRHRTQLAGTKGDSKYCRDCEG